MENGKNIVLGQPEQFSTIEAKKLHEVIDQFGGDDNSKKKKNRFNTLTTKDHFLMINILMMTYCLITMEMEYLDEQCCIIQDQMGKRKGIN